MKTFHGPALRLAILASLVTGCTVIAPDVRMTPVTPVVRPGAAQSFEPFPASSPSLAAPDPSPGVRTFRGAGSATRIGPLALKRGRFTVHVRFSGNALDSQFLLYLDDREGRYLATLENQTGGFEESTSPQVESTDSYYLSLPQADGYWTIDVDANG